MRPLGESISSPHRTYVGAAGRQKPQWTQSSINAVSGGWCGSKLEGLDGLSCVSCSILNSTKETAGVQNAVGVEAMLELAHEWKGVGGHGGRDRACMRRVMKNGERPSRGFELLTKGLELTGCNSRNSRGHDAPGLRD